jgi:hypothetical protein
MSNTERAFTDLVWAGAAGNVAWSIANLIVTNRWIQDGAWTAPDLDFIARLTTLCLLAWFLVTEWLLLIDPAYCPSGPRSPLYWAGDALLVLSIVVLAIALATRGSSIGVMNAALSVGFGVAAIWNFGDGWPESRVAVWVTKGGLNLVGLVVLWVGYNVLPVRSHWHLAGALFAVLVVWRILDLDKSRLTAKTP